MDSPVSINTGPFTPIDSPSSATKSKLSKSPTGVNDFFDEASVTIENITPSVGHAAIDAVDRSGVPKISFITDNAKKITFTEEQEFQARCYEAVGAVAEEASKFCEEIRDHYVADDFEEKTKLPSTDKQHSVQESAATWDKIDIRDHFLNGGEEKLLQLTHLIERRNMEHLGNYVELVNPDQPLTPAGKFQMKLHPKKLLKPVESDVTELGLSHVAAGAHEEASRLIADAISEAIEEGTQLDQAALSNQLLREVIPYYTPKNFQFVDPNSPLGRS